MSFNPIPPLGQALMASSSPIAIASNQTAIPVTGTFFQATQPVSGTVAVSGSVAVTGPLTDTQIRATALPVSLASTTITGTAAISAASLPLPTGAATETTLAAISTKTPALGQATMANSQPVTIASNQTSLNVSDVNATTGPTAFTASDAVGGAPDGVGTPINAASTAGSIVALAVTPGMESWTMQMTGYGTGAVYSEASLDSTNGTDGNWVAVKGRRTGTAVGVESVVYTMVANGTYRGNCAGFTYLRARLIGTGTPSIKFVLSAGSGATFLNSGIPSGTSPIGSVSSVDTTASGAITAAAQAVALALNGKSGAAIQITGTWVGTLQFEGTVDGTNWSTVNGVYAGASTPGPTITANGLVRLTPSGLAQLRITATAWTSGTATITMRASDATGGTFSTQSLTAGANVIGKVGIDQTTPGTTNLVSIGTNGVVALSAGAAAIGSVTVTGTTAVSAASLPLPTGASTEATLAALNTKVTAVNTGAVTISAALPAGTNSIGTVQQAALTKGTQGATGVSTQDLKDAGRNPIHFYMVIPVLTSATDTLQSLTGTKSGATVAATITPAVVTTGKTLRITRLAATYIATVTSGYGIVRLRFNTAGVAAITSPIAATLVVGADSPATANAAGMEEASLSEGWEFAAATGIGISAQGFAAATATAVGYVLVSATGYEY